MTPTAVLRNVLRILAPLCVLLTTYLYLYPVFLGCAFPLPPRAGDSHNGGQPQPTNSISSAAFHSTIQQHLNASYPDRAPFRLLALGDPQLEGDSSIPNYGFNPFWHLEWSLKHLTFRTTQPNFRLRVKQAVHDIVDFVLDDIPLALESLRKRIDLWGNDYYLAHIYRTLRWWTKPTHVTVLGDLLGSQWVSDEEFERRSWRFWNRSFMGAERVPDDIALPPAEEYELAGLLGNDYENDEHAAAWRKRLINVVGNHDIGYAGDITQDRITRFERAFGKTGYELRFELPITNETMNATIYDKMTNPASNRLVPELRLVVINNMNLDTPANDQSLQDKSYAFLNSAISTGSSVDFKGHFTIVLTHIPMYKPAGICVDAPFFDFFSDTGGVKEQNQLSPDASKGFLEGIYGMSGNKYGPGGGMGRRGVILNGHDHEGCDTWHWINQTVEVPVVEAPVVETVEVVDFPVAEAVDVEQHMNGIPLQQHPIRGISLRAQGLAQNPVEDGDMEGEQSVSGDHSNVQEVVQGQLRQPEEPDLQKQEQSQQTEIDEQEFQQQQPDQQEQQDSDVVEERQPEMQEPGEQQNEEQQVKPEQVEENPAEEKQPEEKQPEEEQPGEGPSAEDAVVGDAPELPISDAQQVNSEQSAELPQDQGPGLDKQAQEQAQPQDQLEGQPQEEEQKESPQEQQSEEQQPQAEEQPPQDQQAGHEDKPSTDTQNSAPQQPPPPPEPPKPEWKTSLYSTALSSKLTTAPLVPGIRELTVRSMMGDFGGNAGLLSAWFDEEDWEWKFDFVTCALGRQYMWWFVHSCDFALVVLGLVYVVLRACLKGGVWGEDRWPESWVRWVEGKRGECGEMVENVKGLLGLKRVQTTMTTTVGGEEKVQGPELVVKTEVGVGDVNGTAKVKTEPEST